MKGFNRIVEAAVALAILVGVMGGFLIFNQVAVLGRDRDWAAHSRTVMEVSQQLQAAIQSAENAERGYLITGQDSDLSRYDRAVAALPSLEGRLAQLVADNPAQAAQVSAFVAAVERRRAITERTVAAAKSGDLAGAQAMVRAGEGRAEMDDTHARAAAVDGLESQLLADRSASALRTQGVTLAVGVAVAVLALAMLTVGIVLLARTNRRLEVAAREAEAAEAARESIDALTNALFASVPDALFVLKVEDDDRFVLTDLNLAFTRAFRVSDDRVRGREIRALVPQPFAERLVSHFHRVLSADRPVTTRENPQFPDGPRHWESILAPVKNSDGVADRIVGSIRDITERVVGEQRLQESQRMEAVGQLTGGVAHDFNNLLQVIRGNLELLEGAVESNERAKVRLKNAIFGADRAAQLTRQLLAFARRQPLTPQVVNLSRLVSEMADLLRRTLGETIEVETVVGGGLWNTMADAAQVESAILNLALNARDAMPGGGRLTVEITNASLDEAYARSERDVAPGQYVMLAVSDTGSGMNEETRARVFEPFFTTKGNGTGLGLSMVYGFVKQSSGHIQIYSEPDKGTTVKIYLPRAHQAESRPVLRLVETDAAVDARTILVVEDEEAVRAAALAMLDELGYRRLEAADAAEALAVIESGAVVDLVFSDVVMPGPVGARELADRLRALRPGVPILFTSGYTDNAVIHHGRLDDGVSLISKPYARAELAQRLAQLLSAKERA